MYCQQYDSPSRLWDKPYDKWSTYTNPLTNNAYLDDDLLFALPDDSLGGSTNSSSPDPVDCSSSSKQSPETPSTSPESPSKRPVSYWSGEVLQPRAGKVQNATQQRIPDAHEILQYGQRRPGLNLDDRTNFSAPPVSTPSDNASLCLPRQRPRPAANGKDCAQHSISGTTVPSTAHPMHLPYRVPRPTESYATFNKPPAPSVSAMSWPCPGTPKNCFRRNVIDASPKEDSAPLPHRPIPASLPPSAEATQENFVVSEAFSDPPASMTNSFQNRVYTPAVTPLLGLHGLTRLAYLEDPSVSFPPQHGTHRPDDPQSSIRGEFQSFDFGFLSRGSWVTMPPVDPEHLPRRRPWLDLYGSAVPRPDPSGNPVSHAAETYGVGLGITCNPSHLTRPADTANFPPPPSLTSVNHPGRATPALRPHLSPLPPSPPLHVSASGLPVHDKTPSPPTQPPRTPDRIRQILQDSTAPPAPRLTSRPASLTHRRAKSSTLGGTRHNGTGRKGGGKGADALAADSFINFTPKDSGKILSGVAPSGSSKTKARREREAAAIKRKLSEAVIRAVTDVGGDLDSLRRAGVFEP